MSDSEVLMREGDGASFHKVVCKDERIFAWKTFPSLSLPHLNPDNVSAGSFFSTTKLHMKLKDPLHHKITKKVTEKAIRHNKQHKRDSLKNTAKWNCSRTQREWEEKLLNWIYKIMYCTFGKIKIPLCGIKSITFAKIMSGEKLYLW